MQKLNDFHYRKIKKGLCITFRCINTPRKTGFFCNSCYTKKYRKNNPVKASFYNLKNNAKRRGKKFNLTFEEFKEFAVRVDLISNSGRKKHSYHIDRIDEEKGYTKDNIQLLQNTYNVKKYHIYNKEKDLAFVLTVKTKKIKNKNVPF